jgi:hypothetical protein
VRTSRSSSQDWLEGDSVNNGGYGGAAPTFSELQQAGRPRPPAATSTDRLVPYDLSPANQGKTVPTGPPADAMGRDDAAIWELACRSASRNTRTSQ